MAVSGTGAAVDGTDNPAGISRRHHIFRNVFIRTLPIQLTALSPMVTLALSPLFTPKAQYLPAGQAATAIV